MVSLLVMGMVVFEVEREKETGEAYQRLKRKIIEDRLRSPHFELVGLGSGSSQQ